MNKQLAPKDRVQLSQTFGPLLVDPDITFGNGYNCLVRQLAYLFHTVSAELCQ
jgi:hypothetical protein